jgi:GNAT superfamily N-acetyltransferase
MGEIPSGSRRAAEEQSAIKKAVGPQTGLESVIGPGAFAEVSAPEPLGAHHELDSFDSGVVQLDEWLKRRSRRNEIEGGSRTTVICAGRRVVGYYCLAAGSVFHADSIGKVRRNMPDPVPVVLLGRLALHQEFQGRGLGADLLHDAVLRTLAAAQLVGVRAILVHAISTQASSFYEAHGFQSSPIDPMTLMITVSEAARLLPQANTIR